MFKRIIALLCILLILSAISVPITLADTVSADTVSTEESDDISISGQREDTYSAYLSKYGDGDYPDQKTVIEGSEYRSGDSVLQVLENYEGSEGKSVLTSDNGSILWNVEVKQAGYYCISVEYYPYEGKSNDIVRELKINGEIPFYNASQFTFKRVWVNAEKENERDSRNNDLRPKQVEKPMWSTKYLTDYLGFQSAPYSFYLNQGSNTIELVSVKEPMLIRRIVLGQPDEVLSYNEVKKGYEKSGYQVVDGTPITIQGEAADYKSDPTLYPISDRSSPTTVPYSASKIRLNIIGGSNWKMPGQSITWSVDVQQAGLYSFGMKYRQNAVRGMYVTRKLLVDGEVPFQEAEQITFNYCSDFKNYILGSDEEPYYIYLDKGIHTFTLEVTLGDLSEILNVANDSVYQLNYAYRRILMIMGSTPDKYRDYQLEKKVPDALAIIAEQAVILEDLSNEIYQRTGSRGNATSTLDQLVVQLKSMAEKSKNIQKHWTEFKSKISALAAWILNKQEQPLDIDYLMLLPSQGTMPKAEASFMGRVIHEVKSLVASFVEDYTSIGDVTEDAITVWVQSGRDQAQILKSLIDSDFTKNSGIGVNIKTVTAGVLLQAAVAGKAPDIALQVGGSDPVNYAMRNAVVDLSKFDDFGEIAEQFYDSALVPFQYKNGVYALPETQTFPMLFYRSDILNDLGMKVPETWTDFQELLSVLQKNYMEVGISTSSLSSFTMLLYQSDGTLYDETGSKTLADSEIGVEAFEKWCSFFTDYGLPLTYDFANRFRTGEMPLGIVDYSTYNYLSVFAPEIRGLWNFTPVPGTVDKDGNINRSVAGSVTGCVIMSTTKAADQCWEFLKWWTSSNVQVEYGRELESLLGVAARYTTANKEAMARLSWSTPEYKNIVNQWEWTKGTPEIPGGYFTGRHLDNAFRNVVYHHEDPREMLQEYVVTINTEISNKRKEFRLD